MRIYTIWRFNFIFRFLFIFSILLTNYKYLYSQHFTKKDSLRGFVSDLRSCYDVKFYNLDITIDDNSESIINSSNIIHFVANYDFSVMQIDLTNSFKIKYIEFESQKINYSREFDAIYITFPRNIEKGEKSKIQVFYEGVPKKAKNPPWDGGFSWKKDKNNKPWIAISCQGLGASQWWPCKDHQSDEPDSMRIVCTVRDSLKVISNGNLLHDTIMWNNNLNSYASVYEWFVSYPINTYNVSLNIGNYINFSEKHVSNEDTLLIDYYVLNYNYNKAKNHFVQVIPMLNCFESIFGKYPFFDDGYALVETPYLGMEHQSAIAYGNNYLPGYRGNISFTDSLTFDYIIVHETAHEWWGNSITTNDIADMWVHEGFGTYSEALYVECIYGYESMLSYINNQKKYVKNDIPIVGPFHVNKKGSSDMYFKASLMLHTLRSIINNDNLWYKIIYDISNRFKHQIIDGKDIVDFFNSYFEKDYTVFFNQYLHNSQLPIFEYKIERNGKNITLIYRWEAIENFNMPIIINIGNSDLWLYPSSQWQEKDLGGFDIYEFNVREDLFFIDVKKY